MSIAPEHGVVLRVTFSSGVFIVMENQISGAVCLELTDHDAKTLPTSEKLH